MIYYVSNSTLLFPKFKKISVDESLSLLNSWPRIQFDSETNGRDAHINKILCIQFGNFAARTQIVVDITTIDIMLYKEILEKKPLIGQNLKFDIQFLYKHGIVPTRIYDTMVVEQIIYLGYKPKKDMYSLKGLAKRYLDIDIDKSIRGEIIWRGLDEEVIEYAANDVAFLEGIMEEQTKKLKKFKLLQAAKLECDFVPVISYLEWCGIKLDESKWKDKMKKDYESMVTYLDKLNEFVVKLNNPTFLSINLQGDLFSGFQDKPECNINWNSPAQVIPLAKILGFDTTTTDKKTGEAADTVLEKHLKTQKGINDEFLELYFTYKEHSKTVGTYGESYLNAINPITGRIHTSFRQLGAKSGRMSCGSKEENTDLTKIKCLPKGSCGYPQLQNLPSDHETRAAFVSEPGNLLVSSDFSALESRLGADIYNEQSMIDEFLYKSGDIHSLVAKACFPELKDKTTEEIKKNFPHLRKRAKPIGFSQQFGGTAYAIASSLGCPIEEAETIAKNYNEGFPGIASFKKLGSKLVKDHGYVLLCEHTGHKMFIEEWKDWMTDLQNFGRSDIKTSKWDRLALNGPTQATGIIIMKDAMINLFKWIVDNNLFNKVKICNLIHDEVVCEYPENMTDVPNKVVYFMETSAKKYCTKLPIPAVAESGTYWIH